MINDISIYSSSASQCVPRNIWFGNRLDNYTNWSELEINSVRVSTSSVPTSTPEPTATLTPLPTATPTTEPTATPEPTSIPLPTPTPKHKIIIIPGLGASWNTDAMVFNKEVQNSEWEMTPFVKNYDGLILALKNNGLFENQDFYVWNYDWRQPIKSIVGDLDAFIGEKVLAGEKVDLVGHSLGGLVARIWAQDHFDDPVLGKIISLGSPHFGAVKAYDVWSGAKVGLGFSPENIALNVLIQLQRKNYDTRVDAIRNYAPVLRDILPTFDFVKKNNMVIPYYDLTTVNQYLRQKNSAVDQVFPFFKAMTGIGFPTDEMVSLVGRNIIDRSLGVWSDGHPVSWEDGEGDGTVLLKSAVFSGDISDQLVSDHGNLPGNLINKIFFELELGVPVGVVPTFEYDNAMVFYLGSPAFMSLKCNGNIFNMDKMGFIVVNQNDYQSCRVNLTGIDGGGEYHLVWGNTLQADSWNYVEGEIKGGQNIGIAVDLEDGQLSSDKYNYNGVYRLMDRDLQLLKSIYPKNKSLSMAYKAFKMKNWMLFVNKFFDFRSETKEKTVSFRVLDYFRLLWLMDHKISNKGMATVLYKFSGSEVRMVDRFLEKNPRLSLFGALSYEKLKEVYRNMNNDFNDRNYKGMWIDFILISKLAEEIN